MSFFIMHNFHYKIVIGEVTGCKNQKFPTSTVYGTLQCIALFRAGATHAIEGTHDIDPSKLLSKTLDTLVLVYMSNQYCTLIVQSAGITLLLIFDRLGGKCPKEFKGYQDCSSSDL